MTGPLKPTGAPPVADSALGAGGPDAPSGAEFRDALDATSASAPPEAPAPVDGELARIVEDVRAGRLDPAAAVDTLVARALASPMARGLAPAARAGLEAHLRATLAEDPVLRQLVGDLSRSG